MNGSVLRKILERLGLSLSEVSQMTQITETGLRNCLENRRLLKPHEADRLRWLIDSDVAPGKKTRQKAGRRASGR